MSLTAFLPCRAGSQRVPRKNVRPFADRQDGLTGIKLEQLIACREIDRIILSTNDPEVVRIGENFIPISAGRLTIDLRPDHLCRSDTSTDDLIRYVPNIIPEGDVLWTHVTSPFFDEDEYSAAIKAYFDKGAHDSLVGVTELKTFMWSDSGPINYDRNVEKWPRTQTLPPLYEINSAIFIASSDCYKTQADRIGPHPLLYKIEKIKTVDVDWEDDFVLAAQLWQLRNTAA